MAGGERLGLLGGTFNPVHLGHLRAAEEIAESLALDQVCLMPSAQPPHKSPAPLVSYKHRLEMLRLAARERPGFWVSDLESRLPAPSYTVNTVRAFAEAAPKATIFFMVGLDSFMTLPLWHEYRELLKLASFVVFGRAGILPSFDDMASMLREKVDACIVWNAENAAFTAPSLRPVYFHPGGMLAISSTDLRGRLLSGASVRYLVPEPVRVYIEEHGLYGPQSTHREK